MNVETGDLVSDSCSSATLVGTPVAPPTFVVVFSFWSAVLELFNCVADVAEFSTNTDSMSFVVSNSVVESGEDSLFVVSSVVDSISDVAVVDIRGVVSSNVVSSVFDTVSDVAVVEITGNTGVIVVSSNVGEIFGSSVVELHMW